MTTQRETYGKEPLTEEQRAIQQRLKRLWDTRGRELGLTQLAVANDWQIRQPVVSQYLNGIIPLNLKAVLRFADYLKSDPLTIAPEWEPLIRMASSANTLYVVATMRRDGKLTMHLEPIALDGWVAPVSTAKAIQVERDMGSKCPSGTILVFDEGKTLNKILVLSRRSNTYIVIDRRKMATVYVCDVKDLALVDTETGDEILSLSSPDTDPDFPRNVKVHPLIGRMCLTGVV
jgi:hypothetical protein